MYGAETAERIPALVELQATPSSATVGEDVSVSGVVYDGDGLPISGVAVEISAAPGSADTVRAITDENGGFSHVYAAPGVAGDMTISVVLPSTPSVTGTIVVPVKRAQQVPVGIKLKATPSSVAVGGSVSVTGTVYDGDDLPVAGVEVELAASSGSFEPATAITDANGEFSAIFKAPSAAGEVTITAASAANPSVANTIAVTVHEVVQVPVRIELQAMPSAVTAGGRSVRRGRRLRRRRSACSRRRGRSLGLGGQRQERHAGNGFERPVRHGVHGTVRSRRSDDHGRLDRLSVCDERG
ncbi:Ig-like domain-containing protein [Cohnella rhizosphaerae]|uniref:Carboxypeptidase regulatory-like domain-containing protein n=1 Tax=Cohnella rhizosphaerae TaxID=1457232 RepID=A0A9X4KP63_9BACL|nr:carboxypeptidase regulatory-like domain-containing protein [Cohnella rhizosphaerae]MDG0808611.1 carboxypeptidase regulatory-like domain-containing protein [Cohnella rhizosphaerae]